MGIKSLPHAFGLILRIYRQKAELSQEELADAAGYDRTFISLLERGRRQPSLETVFRLASALKTTPAILVSRTAVFLAGPKAPRAR